jgi:hypothetical protein
MSTKFEQLLDYLVNEEMDKANELFHEIVVEKSRDIYENLIAEEAEEEEMDEAAEEEADESVDEAAESDEEEMDESADEEADESVDLEDSYMMDGDDEEPEAGGMEKTDDFGGDIGAMDEPEGGEEGAIMDIKTAIAELEAAFAELEQAKGMGGDDSFGDEPADDMGPDMGMDDKPEEEMMGMHEGRRMTREYVETVGNDWEKNSMKTQGQYVGAGTGDKDGGPHEGKSPVSSGKGKPVTGATAKNIVAGGTGEGAMDGTTPNGKAGGFVKNPVDMKTGNQNVPGGKVSVKGLTKVAGGHGAEKKGSGPGPVGSGTGDKAGQTSVGQVKSPINGAPNRNA